MNGYIKNQNYKNTHATIVCGLRITQFLIVGLVKYHYSILKSPGLARFGRKFQLLLRFLINTKKIKILYYDHSMIIHTKMYITFVFNEIHSFWEILFFIFPWDPMLKLSIMAAAIINFLFTQKEKTHFVKDHPRHISAKFAINGFMN